MGLRVFVYFVRDHTRPTVPRGRSAAALRDDGEVPEILITLYVIRKGKGLTDVGDSPTARDRYSCTASHSGRTAGLPWYTALHPPLALL